MILSEVAHLVKIQAPCPLAIYHLTVEAVLAEVLRGVLVGTCGQEHGGADDLRGD